MPPHQTATSRAVPGCGVPLAVGVYVRRDRPGTHSEIREGSDNFNLHNHIQSPHLDSKWIQRFPEPCMDVLGLSDSASKSQQVPHQVHPLGAASIPGPMCHFYHPVH